jgi:hypothetical protein
MYSSALAFAGIASQVALESLQSAQHLTSGERLWTEWIAWGLLYLLCRIEIQPSVSEHEEPEDVESQPPECASANITSSTLLAVLFVGVELVSFYAGDNLRWAAVRFYNLQGEVTTDHSTASPDCNHICCLNPIRTIQVYLKLLC